MNFRVLAAFGVAAALVSCTSFYDASDFALVTEPAKTETATEGGEKTAEGTDVAATAESPAPETTTTATPAEAAAATAAVPATTAETTAAAVPEVVPATDAAAAPQIPASAAATTAMAATTAAAEPQAPAATAVTPPATAASDTSPASMVTALAPTAARPAIPAIDDDVVVEAPPEDDEPEAAAFKAPRREKMESLPGVNWPEGIVLVSRTPNDDDPRGFFGGATHPFSRSVAGVPRSAVVAANGLLLAHSNISVACLKPGLLSILRRAETRFGKRVVITSGYRSPPHNRRVRGARNSQHMYCNAVDLYMPGVARDELARYLFALPDRGGIGLYCHTQSIHVDIGSRRAWRWPCYQKKRKKV